MILMLSSILLLVGLVLLMTGLIIEVVSENLKNFTYYSKYCVDPAFYEYMQLVGTVCLLISWFFIFIYFNFFYI